MILPYPVHWDALILLYQGTKSQFIELKFLVEEWPKNGPSWQKFPFLLYRSNMKMPCEYPVDWDELILFSTKNGPKWPLMAKIPNFFILIQYDYAF